MLAAVVRMCCRQRKKKTALLELGTYQEHFLFSGLSLPRTLQVLVWNRQPSCHDELTGKLRTIGYQRVPASMASHMPTAVGNDWQSDVC